MMGNFTCTRLVNILLGIRPILCFFMNLKPYKLLNTLKHSFGWSGGGGGIWHWQIGTREHLSHRFCNIQTKRWTSLVFHIIIFRQHAASIYSFVRFVSFISLCVSSKKICVSVRWVTLWVRPPPLRKYVCPFVGVNCGCVPPSVKICVSVRWVTLWVLPPSVCLFNW